MVCEYTLKSKLHDWGLLKRLDLQVMRQLLFGLSLGLALVACDSAPSGPSGPAGPAGRGAAIAVNVMSRLSAATVTSRVGDFGLPFAARYGVDIYRVLYETVDVHGAPTQASGAVLVPSPVLSSIRLLSFQHGTAVRKENVPSRVAVDFVPALAMASDGYMVALPDYLGLGDSPGLHPYLVASATATAVVDLLRAAKHLADSEGWALTGELFLVGYSEGGFATMATHRALEADYTDEFTVTASAPMAGSYDMSGTMYDMLVIERDPYPQPYYLPYMLFAYDEAYDLYSDPSDYLRSPWDETLPPLFDGRHTGGDINAEMPRIPIEIIREDIVTAVMNDTDHPARRALRENDLTDWAPRAPIRLYHCAADELVPILNSVVAFNELDGPVELIDPAPHLDHGGCAIPSIVSARAWFNSL